MAAMHAVKEYIWLHRLISKLFPSLLSTMTLYCDNQAALGLATDDNYHARIKHIDIRYHFICQVVTSGAIAITYCPTDDMTADMLIQSAAVLESCLSCPEPQTASCLWGSVGI
jgi:hypothetical protein